MGVFGGPEIPNDGLVLALDGANYKSFKGESVTNLYYVASGSSANTSIFSMPMGGTATGSYTTSHSYGSWSGNTIFKVIVSAGTLSGGYESFRHCVPASFDSTYGTSRRLSAKVKMLKGSITSLGFHNGGGTGGHDSGHYTPISEFSVPTDVLSKDGWYQFDVDVSGSYPFGHCVGIGIVGSDIEFLVTEMMLYPSLTFVRFTPTTRGTTVATGGGWADLIGNGNNGELVNGVRESSANGGSLTFDGSNDFIAIPSQFDAQSPLTGYGSFTGADTNAFSLEIWIKTTQISGTNAFTAPHLIGRDDGDIYSNLTLYNGYVYFVHYNSAWLDNLKSTTMVSNGLWHQVVYVNNTNETGTIYIDGISEVSGSSSLSGTNYFSPDYIGRGYSGQYYQGNIANCKFYDKSLSAAEVSQNYNALRGRFGI